MIEDPAGTRMFEERKVKGKKTAGEREARRWDYRDTRRGESPQTGYPLRLCAERPAFV